MKILITGNKGQLGRKIKDRANKFPKFQFLYTDAEELDITNPKAVEDFFNIHKPQLVINCAAYTAVDKAETDEEKAKAVNTTAPAILAQNCAMHNAKLYHISTDYVFGGSEQNTPFTEDTPTAPTSVYGKTKEAGEKKIVKYKNIRIFRTAWLYSEYGNNFVKTMLRLSKDHKELNVVFDQISTPTYAGDLADALLNVALQDTETNFDCDILHYTNEGVCSWYDFTKEIFNIKNINCKVNPIRSYQYPTPAKRPVYSVLDKSKIKEKFNISIPYYKTSLEYCMNKL